MTRSAIRTTCGAVHQSTPGRLAELTDDDARKFTASASISLATLAHRVVAHDGWAADELCRAEVHAAMVCGIPVIEPDGTPVDVPTWALEPITEAAA